MGKKDFEVKDALVKFPKGFVCGEAEWMEIVEEWKREGKFITPMKVKTMFPEQFS